MKLWIQKRRLINKLKQITINLIRIVNVNITNKQIPNSSKKAEKN